MTKNNSTIFKQIPTIISDLNKLGIALKSLDAMKLGTVGVNLANVEGYRTALKGLSVEQSVFALASKGATEEQIRQILIINEAIAKDVEAAIAKAGLTTATKALTREELIGVVAKTGIAKKDAEQLLIDIGLISKESEETVVKKQLTMEILKQAVATGKLNSEKAKEIALSAGLTSQGAKLGNVTTGLFSKAKNLISSHPYITALAIVGSIGYGVYKYYKTQEEDAIKAIVEAHENAKQALEDAKTSLSDDKSELQSVNSELETTKQRIQEISSIGAPTLVDQNELNKLSTSNAQLETQKTLLENNIKLKQKSAARDAKELLKTQVEMKYSNILDGSSIESHNESYSYKDHAKYQASNLQNAYAIYMKALRDGDVIKQQLAQELIDVSAGNSAVLTSKLLEIIESFKYEDGTIIEGYEELYNEYMGFIYNLQSLTNPDTFLDIAKSVTSNTGIDFEKAISDAYKLAYEGNFDIDKLNQDFVKALANAGIDESTINYIFRLKQQEYQLLVDKINDKYKVLREVSDNDRIEKYYWDEHGNIHTEYVDIDEETKRQLNEIYTVNKRLNEYAKENPIEFQLVFSFDENFETLDKYIEEERIKAENNTDYVGDYITNAIKRIYDEAKVQSSAFNIENPISLGDIFSLKDADNDLTKFGKISESIDTIQNAYKTLNDAIDEYNEEGAFSIDTLQSVIALGDDWLDYLVDEQGNLKLDKESLEELTQARLNDMRIQAINNVIDNVSKIQDEAGANEYLASTNYALADSYEAAAKARLSDARASMAKAVEDGRLSQSSMDEAMKKATADIDKINKLFANTSIGAGSITGNFGKGKSSSQSEFSETVDFFEQRVKNLDNALSHLKSTMDNISGSSAKNNLVDAELGITGEKFKNYTDALSMYTKKANEALSKLPADIAAKVKNGAVALTDFIGDGNKDVVEAIKDYESWADKVADCKQELAELQKEIRQLELEKFNNIMEDFQNQFDLRGDSKDLISKQIDLLKEAGELIGESFFTAQIDQSKKQLELLEAEKAQLVNQMSSAINSGRIQKGTEEWLSMVNALSDVDSSILDCKKSIEEFDNSILEIHTEIFNRIQDQFSNLDSEISNILDLFEEFKVSDEKGIWSKEGIAQLGLLSQQYELAQYQIQQYNNEIDKLNAQYLAGKYSATEYADKLADLTDKQWDAVKASESAKDALMDLNETRIENQISGIEKEIDAYKELTDAQIDALKASKDLHDYENSIADKTKSITDLEHQIAAMQNDNSAATVAKRKKLEEQLAEAKKDLEEAEYDHSIEAQEDALNKQYEQYEKSRNDEIDALRESLNDKETIIANSFDTVKNNAATVGQEIATIATQHGITVSKSLISSWQSGEKAIASYGAVLSQNTSAFIGNIMDVENEVWNLQAQANTTADSLAWMFSTKADNLVNELTTSYFAESNLAYMTQALQNSLINTLERGYNVNSIVNSLKSIEDGANSAKTAIDKLNSYRTGFIENVANSAHSVIEKLNSYRSDLEEKTAYFNDSNKQKYQLIDKKTGKIYKDNLTSAEVVLEVLKDKNIPINMTLKEYASGTRSSKGSIIITDEDGYEMKFPKLASGQYTIANEGTQILTKAQTDNIFEWAKFNPEDFVPVNMTAFMDNLKASTMPNILPNNVSNSSVNVHYDNMINVQGSLNSTDVKQMEAIANNAVDRMVDKINDGITYGR